MPAQKYVYPKLGRAGLGNELFPYLRALDIAEREEARLVPPRWMQLRIGPTLRGERDARQYWRLFKSPTLQQHAARLYVEARLILARVPRIGAAPSSIVVEAGMKNYFADLQYAGGHYRAFLRRAARSAVLTKREPSPFLSAHIRLGDFERSTAAGPSKNNVSTPLAWYIHKIEQLRAVLPELQVVISSDGSDEELAGVLELPMVRRSDAKNALDEIMLISEAAGLLGSRSTFSAWGAFLGDVPMLVADGGNAYAPHQRVWESSTKEVDRDWTNAVRLNLSK